MTGLALAGRWLTPVGPRLGEEPGIWHVIAEYALESGTGVAKAKACASSFERPRRVESASGRNHALETGERVDAGQQAILQVG